MESVDKYNGGVRCDNRGRVSSKETTSGGGTFRVVQRRVLSYFATTLCDLLVESEDMIGGRDI